MTITRNAYTITITKDDAYRASWWRYEVTGFRTYYTGWAMSKAYAVKAAQEYVDSK